MRLTARHLAFGLLAMALFNCTGAAPVPSPSPKTDDVKENAIEAYEDGLLIFVPTIPAADKEKSGQELKREVEYELIAIPGELLRREIRQVAQQYGAPSAPAQTPLVIQADSIEDRGEIIIPGLFGGGYPNSGSSGLSFSKPSLALPSKSGFRLPTLQLSSAKPDFGSVISSVTGQAADFAGGAGQTLASVGLAGTQVLGQVGSAAAAGGAQLGSWLVNQKSKGISTATQVVGGGLQYAGQLSASVLRALLQVPGIKARVLSEIIQAGQPLVYAVSDVLAESSDDLADVFEAKTSILQDALSIIIRLINDTLALKGRIIYSLSTKGLDIGATAFNAGVQIGGAAVEAATGIASAVGGGVADIVAVGKSVNLPPAPPLPPLSLPTLPNLSIPKISLPNVDLSALIPTKTSLAPLPLPAKPQVTFSTSVQAAQPSYGAPLPEITISSPSQSYGSPGR